MKDHTYANFLVIGGLCLIILSGCGTHHCAQSSTRFLRIANTENISIERACVHDTEKGVVIHGSIERRPSYRSQAWGHVDIAAIDAEGAMLWQESAMCAPKRVPQYPSHSYFSANFTLPKNADVTLQVKYHNHPKLCESTHS